jgi:transcriptional regulator with XRE-family HTH domain
LKKEVAVSQERTAAARKLSTPGGGSDKESLGRVGLAVRVARIGRGFSQRELGKKVGKSQNLIWTIESGKKDPGIVLLARIAEALQMPLEFFLVPIQRPRSGTTRARAKDFTQGRDILVSLMEGLSAAMDYDEREHEKKGKSRGK